MKRLGIAIAIAIIWGGVAEATCHPKLRPGPAFELRQKRWFEKSLKLPDTAVDQKSEIESLLGQIGVAMKKLEKNPEEQESCRTVNRISARLDSLTGPENPLLRKISDVPDSEFLDWAMWSTMEGSVFEKRWKNKAFAKRVLALNDNDFTKLMSQLNIWHGGNPLWLIIEDNRNQWLRESPALWTGSTSLREFWNRIKQLKDAQIKKILTAEYNGMSLAEWLEQLPGRLTSLPADIRSEIYSRLDRKLPELRAKEERKAQKKEALQKMNLSDLRFELIRILPKENIDKIKEIEKINPQALTDSEDGILPITLAASGENPKSFKYLYEQHIAQKRPLSKDELHEIISILSIRDIGKELLPYLKSKGVTNDKEIAQIRKVAEAEMMKAMQRKEKWAAKAGK